MGTNWYKSGFKPTMWILRTASHSHFPCHTAHLELQIVFRYHGPNDPWLCKMIGQFWKGWVSDNLKCTHLNHSLYLWKTLLTKSAVAGFQLWVSSLAAFCLATRRFSLLRDKEVDVCWLVLVLGCQLITCSDARQGSRSSTLFALHCQLCFAHAAMLLFGAVFGTPFVKISMVWWGLVVQADRSSLVSFLFLWRASLAHTP